MRSLEAIRNHPRAAAALLAVGAIATFKGCGNAHDFITGSIGNPLGQTGVHQETQVTASSALDSIKSSGNIEMGIGTGEVTVTVTGSPAVDAPLVGGALSWGLKKVASHSAYVTRDGGVQLMLKANHLHYKTYTTDDGKTGIQADIGGFNMNPTNAKEATIYVNRINPTTKAAGGHSDILNFPTYSGTVKTGAKITDVADMTLEAQCEQNVKPAIGESLTNIAKAFVINAAELDAAKPDTQKRAKVIDDLLKNNTPIRLTVNGEIIDLTKLPLPAVEVPSEALVAKDFSTKNKDGMFFKDVTQKTKFEKDCNIRGKGLDDTLKLLRKNPQPRPPLTTNKPGV
jgi:hypothetical protein